MKKALITAAASGIGAVVAKAARQKGYAVTISDIDDHSGESLAREEGFAFHRCDLRSEEDIVALVRAVGAVDLLVNNGGISGPTAPTTDVSLADWQQVLDVNLTAQFLACREMVPLMLAAGGGSIVNMSSVAGKIGYPNRAPYAASKWAILGLTAALAREVGSAGIRVNAILPGTVRGARIEQVIADYARINGVSPKEAEIAYLTRHATTRFVEPSEIAAMILHLASDDAKSVTGQFVSVDGGFH
ncbi:MAG TPA: SDR family oxidoreductase [Rhizomicrobium sp.]